MDFSQTKGDLLDQDVEVIVNSWNRNIIPWWLLLPQGVSGAIKKCGGKQPFREIAKYGPIPLGEARMTGPGNLNYKAIIHVAGINCFWIASKYSISESVRSAIKLADENGFKSIAFPLIGSGSGNRGRDFSKNVMQGAFSSIKSDISATLVIYER